MMGIEQLFSQSQVDRSPVSITLSAGGRDDGYTVTMKWALNVKFGDQLHTEEISTYNFGINSNYQGIFQEQRAVEKGLKLACSYAERFQENGCNVTINDKSVEEARQKLIGLDEEYKKRLKTL